MTREKAIIFIKNHVMWGEYSKGDYEEALEMAIQALEEKKSPCDLCRYNPPSSFDGKPCCMCPAESV